MKLGNFYCVGIGPGDPKLITMDAVNLLQEKNYIFIPKARIKGESLAYNISKNIIHSQDSLKNKKIITLEFPMTHDPQKREEKWNQSADRVIEILKSGNDAAFITLGDPMVYSTYIYLMSAIKNKAPGVRFVTIPGITSYNYAACQLNLPLVIDKEKMAVLPANDLLENFNVIADIFETIIIMKIGRNLPRIFALLEENNLIKKSVFIQNIGLENSYIEYDLKKLDIHEKGRGYFSLIIVKNEK